MARRWIRNEPEVDVESIVGPVSTLEPQQQQLIARLHHSKAAISADKHKIQHSVGPLLHLAHVWSSSSSSSWHDLQCVTMQSCSPPGVCVFFRAVSGHVGAAAAASA